MEGPTPVSALIHAATMVTAGVFLIIRCSPLFEYAPKILGLIMLLGALTALFGATAATVQNDIKKIIAYSTCSQLGYMFMACGTSNYVVGFFHLFNHAFFKALLFLCAGVIIHTFFGEQDIRTMGGMLNYLPTTYIMFFIASLSLMGFPFFSGFYSKDMILDVVFSSSIPGSKFSYLCGSFAAFLTSFYSIRLLFFVFFKKPRGSQRRFLQLTPISFPLAALLAFLFFGSVFSGYLFKDFFVGIGSFTLQHCIFIFPKHNNFINAEFLPFYIKLIPIIFSMLGSLAAFVLYFNLYYFLYFLKLFFIRLYKF